VGDVQHIAAVQHVQDRARHQRLGAASDIHIGMGGAFLAEVVFTAMFVFVILAVTSKIGNAATAGMAIGLALTVAHLAVSRSPAPRSIPRAASGPRSSWAARP
jgi:glycerol uptake facilitator-like aquaporin